MHLVDCKVVIQSELESLVECSVSTAVEYIINFRLKIYRNSLGE